MTHTPGEGGAMGLPMPTENEPVVVWEGDCLDLLRGMPDGCVDAVITSPPYNLNLSYGDYGGTATADKHANKIAQWYPDQMPEHDYQLWQTECVSEMLRVTAGSVFYNHRVRYAWHPRNKHRLACNIYHPLQWLSGLPIWAEIIWDRGGTASPSGRFNLSHEYIYQLGKPSRQTEGCGTSVWRFPPSPSTDDHPCPFPVELPRRCIRASTEPGDIILDPFAGSGTTGVAAMREGRRAILIEKDPKYAALCRERVGKAMGKGSLLEGLA